MNLIKVKTVAEFSWVAFGTWKKKDYMVDGTYINLDDVKYITPKYNITNRSECETTDPNKVPKIEILYYRVRFGHECYIDISIDSYEKIVEYINKNHLEEKYNND